MDIKYKAAYSPLILLLLSSCDMIEYHPYDLDIRGEKEVNRKNILMIESNTATKDSISFILISDTQRWYDETEDAVQSINKLSDIDFVIHAGDLSDFGMKLEFEKQRDILNHLNVPYVCLLGNHDCLATGKDVFNIVFGQENFSFNAGTVHIVCLNTNALEFDYSTAVPDFSFLGNDIASTPSYITHTVVVMHAPPYSEQFDNNVALPFQHYLHKYPSLEFCMYGHIHQSTVTDMFDDGIYYYSTASINKRSYLHFTITAEGYSYEEIPF